MPPFSVYVKSATSSSWGISFFLLGPSKHFTRHSTNAVSMLGNRRSRWPIIEKLTAPTIFIVFVGCIVRGSVPGPGGLKETKMFLPHSRVKVSIVGNIRDREVACSASDRQGSNFESCVWRTVSSQSSHHPQEVLLAQFSLYVHKGSLKPDSFHFISFA